MADDRSAAFRFRIILGLIAMVFAVPAILIPGWTLPERERVGMEQVPPRLAKLVERADPMPEPAPEPEQTPEALAEPNPEPLPEVAREPAPEKATPPAASEVNIPEPPPEPEDIRTKARQTASKSGLFAMKDRLAELTATHDVPVERLEANVDSDALGQPQPEDKPLEQDLTAGSGGIATVKGPGKEVAVAGHTVAEVSAPDAPVVTGQSPASSRSSGAGERTMSNIRQVFDAQKSALYALYQRELRQDPTLAGKLTLELIIEPDGSVSDCRVLNSELENAALEQRIALRVRMFNFGAADVDTRRVAFPIDFLPG
ncbi:MAG TPA: AgmX/PglI C-terminal domain-containing protein [Marinobacter sp.]|nr:AgmX/PglI C-terminal domain-containing protein [Marinobacter sp.]